MAELRKVCPLLLKPNPHNPRITPPPAAMEEQLLASIKAIGIIQPPIVVEKDGELVIKAGTRRVTAAIAAGFETIDVIVADGDEANGPMESLSENLIRASMNSVDIWRGIDALEQRGWIGIGGHLAVPPLPHHRAYGSRTRRFDWVKLGQDHVMVPSKPGFRVLASPRLVRPLGIR